MCIGYKQNFYLPYNPQQFDQQEKKAIIYQSFSDLKWKQSLQNEDGSISITQIIEGLKQLDDSYYFIEKQTQLYLYNYNTNKFGFTYQLFTRIFVQRYYNKQQISIFQWRNGEKILPSFFIQDSSLESLAASTSSIIYSEFAMSQFYIMFDTILLIYKKNIFTNLSSVQPAGFLLIDGFTMFLQKDNSYFLFDIRDIFYKMCQNNEYIQLLSTYKEFKCTSNYYQDVNKCAIRTNYCKICSSLTTCSKCLSSFQLTQDGQCICKEGSFITSDNQCIDCNSSWQTCNGLTKNSCLSCRKGKYLFDNNSCGDCDISNGFFINEKFCMACHETCQFCNGKSSTSCLSCKNGKYLNENNLCDSCNVENGQYILGNQCLKCINFCKTCSGNGKDQCTECQNNYQLFNNYCEKKSQDYNSTIFNKNKIEQTNGLIQITVSTFEQGLFLNNYF
ncbi:hypothetical protein ABPG72_016249 [Tetrahymena utriculariae]